MAPTTPISRISSINHDFNDNAERSILSSVTDWDEYADRVTQKVHKEGTNAKEGYEVEAGVWRGNANSAQLKSVGEINSRGTLTLEKDDNSVVPKSWLNAMHGDNSSIFSQQQEEEYGLEACSSDTSTENFSDSNHGAFPGYNNGAFPTRNPNSIAERHDWSHIGTVDEDRLSESNPSALEIGQTLSQETGESKNSLTGFISDLVWLEQKIADENAKESIEVNLKEGIEASDGIQIADSYSYDCDSFSPRTLSDDESTVTSITNSQAMSIVCRDCYIPPGKLDIEITSTKDGPVIKSIGDKSLGGHLKVGDLIMALDDNDTRSQPAEELAATLSARSSFQRKLTLLHFGGSKT